MKVLNKVIIEDKKILTLEVKEHERRLFNNIRRFRIDETPQGTIYIITTEKHERSFAEKLTTWQNAPPDVVHLGAFGICKSNLTIYTHVTEEDEEGRITRTLRTRTLPKRIIDQILQQYPCREEIIRDLKMCINERDILL